VPNSANTKDGKNEIVWKIKRKKNNNDKTRKQVEATELFSNSIFSASFQKKHSCGQKICKISQVCPSSQFCKNCLIRKAKLNNCNNLVGQKFLHRFG